MLQQHTAALTAEGGKGAHEKDIEKAEGGERHDDNAERVENIIVQHTVQPRRV